MIINEGKNPRKLPDLDLIINQTCSMENPAWGRETQSGQADRSFSRRGRVFLPLPPGEDAAQRPGEGEPRSGEERRHAAHSVALTRTLPRPTSPSGRGDPDVLPA